MTSIEKIFNFLKKNKLILATAESCTGGRISHLLSKIEGSGECLYVGFVVYSAEAKKSLLGVQQKTIDEFTLTSEEVAQEMVIGALNISTTNVAVAATGLAGSEPMNGIEPGTICFAWGFKHQNDLFVYSKTVHFHGKKEKKQNMAAKYALSNIPSYYQQFLNECGKNKAD